MSSVPSSPHSKAPSSHTHNTRQISQSKVASRPVESALVPQRPKRLSTLETSSSSRTGVDTILTGATTTTLLPAVAVAPGPPGPFPDGRPMVSSTQEYQAKMRDWHNQIGKKYRNKLNDKFEGLQAVLVHVASHVDTSLQGSASASSDSPRGMDDEGDVVMLDGGSAVSHAERLEVLRRMQQEEELLDGHEFYDEDEDGEDEDDDDPERPSARGGATRRPRRRRTKGINKARVLAMARKTIVTLAAERDQLLRELAGEEAGEESE